MKINVKVPDKLAAQADALGVALEAYVEQILKQQAQVLEQQAEADGNSVAGNPAEIRAWLDSLAQFSGKIPPLPKNITRDWIYLDHD